MHRRPTQTSVLIRLGLILICCCVGFFISMMPHHSFATVLAQERQSSEIQVFPANATTDRVPQSLQVGQSLYVQNCGSCHIAIPPAVFPSQTWDQLLQDTSHYGAVLDPILEPEQSWIRRYLRFGSRLVNQGESTPYRFRQSRYFKILHPQVDMPSPVTTQTCIICHAKAPEFNFRQFSASGD